MATTPSSVFRLDDPSGDSFLTFDIGTGEKAQGVVIINANGQHAGITGFPLVISGTVTVDSSVTAVNTTPVLSGTPWAYNNNDANTGLDTGLLVNPSGACKLYELRVLLDPSVLSDRYLFLFDSNNQTGPVVWRGVLPQDGELSETFQYGLDFTDSISFGISSTIGLYTVTSSNEAFVHARGTTG